MFFQETAYSNTRYHMKKILSAMIKYYIFLQSSRMIKAQMASHSVHSQVHHGPVQREITPTTRYDDYSYDEQSFLFLTHLKNFYPLHSFPLIWSVVISISASLQLLSRVFNIMREKNPDMVAGEKRKFVMKPPQVVRVGTKKTSFVNFTDICKL